MREIYPILTGLAFMVRNPIDIAPASMVEAFDASLAPYFFP
jgi:hypothetical protein